MKRLSALFLSLIMIFPLITGILPANAAYAENIDEVEAKYFDVKPVIDGYISEAEWGEATVWSRQNFATTVGDTTPYPNRFFYNLSSYDKNNLYMQYFLWLRWDEDYFYIGAKVYDPDGHSNKNARSELWDGDALQVRIDPDGANAICYGDTFYPEDFPNEHKPWGSRSVCDLIFGYTQNAWGYKEAWNNTAGTNKSMLTINAYTQTMGLVNLAIGPAGTGFSSDTVNGITTYEIAIPWKYIDYSRQQGYNGHEYYKHANFEKKNPDGSIKQGPNGAIGYEYGMSAVVFNADGTANGNSINAALTWGSGILDRQHLEDSYMTCAGSNAVTLVADKVSEDDLYNANYITYNFGGYNTSILRPEYDTEIDDSIHKYLTYDDYSDMEIFGEVSNGERVQLDDGNWVVQWDRATERDEPDYETGEAPVYNTYNFLSTDGYSYDGSDVRYETVDNSFTFEFDIKVTSLETFENGYGSMLYNWFGGTSSIDYQCGYFFDEGKFKIVNTSDPSEVVAEYKYDFTLNEWHHWIFQYDDASCTLRFYFDPPMINGKVSPKATPVFNVYYRYFDYGTIEKTYLIFRRLNAQIQLDNVQMYNFVDFPSMPDTDSFTFVQHDRLFNLYTVTGHVGEPADALFVPHSKNGSDNVTNIGEGAFEGLSYVKEIYLPDSIDFIRPDAFKDCTSLDAIYLESPAIWYPSELYGDFESYIAAELSDGATVNFDLTSDKDKVSVIKFTPENSAFYNISTSGDSFDMIWVLSEDMGQIIGSFSSDLAAPTEDCTTRIDLKKGKTYYIVARNIDPKNTVSSADLIIERSPRIAGDINDDGVISIGDVLTARKLLVGLLNPIPVNMYNADVTGDGKLTVGDILLIRKYIAGLVDTLE